MTDQTARPSEQPRPRKRQTIFDRARDAIQDAIERGDFDNLPGKGQPLDFSDEDNPFIPDDLRQAWRMLRSNGFALPWMEDRKDIEKKRQALEREVQLHARHLQSAIEALPRMPAYLRPSRSDRLKTQHAAFLVRLTRSLDALNAKIDIYNLTVPVVTLQVRRVNRQRLLAPIEAVLPSTVAPEFLPG